MLKWFASKQIRNVGSIAGNIMTGSPISDLNPILIAAGCLLIFKSKNQEGSRHLELNEKFYTSYRKNLARKDEVLISILIPFSSENEFFTSYKQSRRRDDDIAIVNSAFYFKFDGDILSHGGAPGGMERYRQTLLIAFLYKAFLKVSCEKEITHRYQRNIRNKTNFTSLPIQVIKLLISPLQVCGEAIYVDDMPEYKNQVYAAFVLIHGYIRFLSSDDVPRNTFRISSIEDEYVFAKNDVHHVGQIIGMVLGDTLEAAREASNLVKVQYEEYKPILTIEDAIINESFYELKREISKGDVDKAYQNCDHIIEGESSTGAQEHFYLEPNVGIATFEEEGEVRIYTTTQNPTETQAVIARVLNYPMSRVHCIAKRLGGGFGGKETRNIPFSVAAAVAAKELKRPVKFILDRDEDMMLTGHRHSSLIKYKAGSGGVEMGQGLSTKMIQIASQVLGTSYEKISIIETSTDKVPNSSPTAASLGSDLYGAAVLEACNSLNSRLEPIKKDKEPGQGVVESDGKAMSLYWFHKGLKSKQKTPSHKAAKAQKRCEINLDDFCPWSLRHPSSPDCSPFDHGIQGDEERKAF
ncbi:XDH [Lepeophtheirus salmonis]|uniref:XDH n=1 Tax=Lepeophtheirus salmonis TaxID=72036 RepID=A0A7R8D3Y9_LEPSM|nr:XDH [Lepeophtheirus salmonis]CAF3016425.1 XDH [Lepeophtheirus salmonis]